MKEYYINVSANGQFMFRTEWDDNKERAYAAAVTLRISMPLAKVEMFSRDKSMTRIDDYYKQ